jgi:hypothetical protein
MSAIDFATARLRVNPAYRLIEPATLGVAERARLAQLVTLAESWAVLVPVAPGHLPCRAICPQTRALLTVVQQPAPLPAALNRQEVKVQVLRLVLDHLLEVEIGESFVGGPRAYGLLGSLDLPQVSGLSGDALGYGQALAVDDEHTLAMRLYLYNRIPASDRWVRRFRDPQAVAHHLGVGGGDPCAGLGHTRWVQALTTDDDAPWFSWQAVDAPRLGDCPLHKLYISPRPEAFGAVFRAAVACFNRSRAVSFKVGRTLDGVLRPDKLIAYFVEPDALQEAARRLAVALAGQPAQGVPFAAALTGDGMLFSGMDPPLKARFGEAGPTSWRWWICRRLAAHLSAARREGIDPGQFALARLALDGVDTDTWMPKPELWSEEQAWT